MPDEKRPDARFLMIAEEMTVGVRPNVIVTQPNVRVSGGYLECPRWVLGGSERMDAWLRAEVITVRDRLGDVDPVNKKVSMVPDVRRLVERELKPPAGVMLYVDHTFYESARKR